MTRALDSAIGLPRRSTSTSRILVLLMPPEVRRYFMMPLLMYTWSRRCRPAKKETSLHVLAKSFLNRGNVLGRMSRSPGKKVAGGLVTDDGGHRSGQLIIGELVQEVHCVLPRRQVIRCQHLNTVVMGRVDIGLIDAGDGTPQPLFLLRGQRAPIAQDARHRHSLRVLQT